MQNILLDKRYRCRAYNDEDIKIFSVGDDSIIKTFIYTITNNEEINSELIKDRLSCQTGHFAFILKYNHYIYAAVDIICSYPLFYLLHQDEVIVSNSAQKLKTEFSLNDIDSIPLLEFYMAGYVTGKDTIIKNLYKIQPGELLVINTKENNYKREQYYSYFPTINCTDSKSNKDYLNELDIIMDDIFQRIIKKANGLPIWLPLSGGLDSRFIACKLKQFNYPSLYSFSYGPSGNYEAKAAKKVANDLDIPWIFVDSNSKRERKLFQGKKRKEYWEFASGSYSLPSMMEYEALYELTERNIIPKNAIIINGQTGDFITGGHIPKALIDKGSYVHDLIDAIISKHYSVWQNIPLHKSFDQIKNKIIELLDLENKTKLNKEELASYFEFWEWQSRQSMSVVNGQRLYDFFGYQWMLPLWEKSLVTFYQNVPLELRLGQNLFIDYLEKFNYKNLFKGYRSEHRRLNLFQMIFLKCLSIPFKILGLDNNNIYKYSSYWSHYSNQYGFYGLKYFLKNIGDSVTPPQARGVVALGIKYWLKENLIEMEYFNDKK